MSTTHWAEPSHESLFVTPDICITTMSSSSNAPSDYGIIYGPNSKLFAGFSYPQPVYDAKMRTIAEYAHALRPLTQTEYNIATKFLGGMHQRPGLYLHYGFLLTAAEQKAIGFELRKKNTPPGQDTPLKPKYPLSDISEIEDHLNKKIEEKLAELKLPADVWVADLFMIENVVCPKRGSKLLSIYSTEPPRWMAQFREKKVEIALQVFREEISNQIEPGWYFDLDHYGAHMFDWVPFDAQSVLGPVAKLLPRFQPSSDDTSPSATSHS
ncbi:hypothetical protein BD413DRAFT_554829 [Trametes elegans]|nr:hypothetical protein BD413DRAFT_554829 [Trametes elegans]